MLFYDISGKMTIKVLLINGQKLDTLTLDVTPKDTVDMVKNQIEKLKKTSLKNYRVMFGLTQLTNDMILEKIGVTDGKTLTITKSSKGISKYSGLTTLGADDV